MAGTARCCCQLITLTVWCVVHAHHSCLRADTLDLAMVAATAETTDVVLREAHEALDPKVK